MNTGKPTGPQHPAIGVAESMTHARAGDVGVAGAVAGGFPPERLPNASWKKVPEATAESEGNSTKSMTYMAAR